MKCEPCTSLLERAEDYLPTSSLDTPQSLPSNGTPTAAECSESEPQTDGSPACKCTREMCGCSIHPNTRAEWIASQRASLARIFQRQEKEKELRDREADLSLKSSAQLTLFTPLLSGSKTAHESERGEGMWLSGNWWRVDTPGATESLDRLMLAPIISGIDGGVLLPTLTVCGNYNRKGASPTSGDGIITAIKRRMMPTLCARDARTVAGSQPPKRSPTSGLPLTWILGKDLTPESRRGLKLNPIWAAWYMGWPMTWFLAPSKLSATGKSRSKRPRHGQSSEGQ